MKLSASVQDGFVVHSFAGDDPIACRDYIRERLGLEPFKPNGGGGRTITYEYRDPVTGDVRYRKERIERPDGSKTFFIKPKGRNGSAPLFYGGERLADLAEGQPVWIVEGEEKVKRMRELVAIAVCADSGADSKWLPEHVALLRGLPVILCPDSDIPGESYIANAARCIRAEDPGADVKVVRLFGRPNGAKGLDICDWKGSAEELLQLAETAEVFANDDRDVPREPEKPAAESNGDACAGRRTTMINGIPKRVTNFGELNSRFALLEAPGLASVYINRRAVSPLTHTDLKRRLEGEVVEVGINKDGNPVFVPAFKFWTGHAHKHSYRRIVFTGEEAPAKDLNLYRGLGVKPQAGCVKLILQHIDEVICAGDSANAIAMLNLLAWQIQNIGKPSRIVVVLISEIQQAGKGLLLLELIAKIYGPSGFVPSAVDQVLGRFNDAIRGCAFAFLDEVLFSGDRRAADAVKSLSTTTEIGIETKNVPVVKCPVAINLWVASNHENAVHVEEGDARYWILKVSEHRIGDHAYFTALTKEIEHGGREAFAYYLLNRDVSEFVPWRNVPRNNAAKQEMIRLSINPYDARKWLEDCCHAGQIIGRRKPFERDVFNNRIIPENDEWQTWVEGEEWIFTDLANAYVEWQKTVKSPVAPKPTPKGSLGELFNKAGIEVRRSGASGDRLRYLPSHETCLSNIWKR